jgi:hypothetical protein
MMGDMMVVVVLLMILVLGVFVALLGFVMALAKRVKELERAVARTPTDWTACVHVWATRAVNSGPGSGGPRTYSGSSGYLSTAGDPTVMIISLQEFANIICGVLGIKFTYDEGTFKIRARIVKE